MDISMDVGLSMDIPINGKPDASPQKFVHRLSCGMSRGKVS